MPTGVWRDVRLVYYYYFFNMGTAGVRLSLMFQPLGSVHGLTYSSARRAGHSGGVWVCVPVCHQHLQPAGVRGGLLGDC